MYAVFAHGGKQYRVAPGEKVRVERVAGEKGAPVEFADVRLVGEGDGVRLGKDATGVKVTGTILVQDRAAKCLIFKKKRCKQYRRTRGHRQGFTEVRIERIA